jgi:hypothetical protein
MRALPQNPHDESLEEGITLDEINEAAWLAVSFCGSPAMMFYKEVRGKLEQRKDLLCVKS